MLGKTKKMTKAWHVLPYVSVIFSGAIATLAARPKHIC